MPNPPSSPMHLLPLRLAPGDDLRRALVAALQPGMSGFVVAGIGSLLDARLRLAGEARPTVVAGPSEILTLAGSLADNGPHLHMSIATASGQVFGGHVVDGNIVRTTAEVLIALLPGWQLQREPDAGTGYDELVVRPRPEG